MTAATLENDLGFDLTINRVGALAGCAIKTVEGDRRLCDEKIIGTFREQAHDLWTRGSYGEAEQRLLDIIAEQTQPDHPVEFLEGGMARDGSLEPIQVTTMPVDPDDAPRPAPGIQPAIVALFPARRVRFVVDDMPWIVRTRASVTACALQQQDGFAKVWWTFEGVPDSSPLVRPSEKQATAFLQLTELLADAAIPKLREAFRQSLAALTNGKVAEFDPQKDAIRISMTDTDAQPVGALFDALYFNNCHLSDIRSDRSNPDALQGLHAFEDFVGTIASVERPIDERKVTTNDSSPGARAILFTDDVQPLVTVAGFARHAGPSIELGFLSPKQQREEKAEAYLRATSAARPISARIAGEQAAVIEKRAKDRMNQYAPAYG
jgi:hypothetical protein